MRIFKKCISIFSELEIEPEPGSEHESVSDFHLPETLILKYNLNNKNTTEKQKTENNIWTLETIATQLDELCMNQDLSPYYAAASILHNTNMILIENDNKENELLGFATYEKIFEKLEKYTTPKISKELEQELNKNKLPIQEISENSTIEIDVIVTKQKFGVGTIIIKKLQKQNNIFLKSLNSAYWFYIKFGFKQFKCEKTMKNIYELYELPYCEEKTKNPKENIKKTIYYTSKYIYTEITTKTKNKIVPFLTKETSKEWTQTNNFTPITHKYEVKQYYDDNLIPLFIPSIQQSGGNLYFILLSKYTNRRRS